MLSKDAVAPSTSESSEFEAAVRLNDEVEHNLSKIITTFEDLYVHEPKWSYISRISLTKLNETYTHNLR